MEAQLPATIYALGFILTYAIKPESQVIYFWTMQHTKIYVISLLGKCSPLTGRQSKLNIAVLNFRTTFRRSESSPTADVPVSQETVSPGFMFPHTIAESYQSRNPNLFDRGKNDSYAMEDLDMEKSGNAIVSTLSPRGRA